MILTKHILSSSVTKILPININQIHKKISTQVIKQYQKQITKKDPSLLKQYPKTFQDKVFLLNNPTMIQSLEVIEFGVKYKDGKRWLVLLFLAAGLFGFIHQKILPTRVIDRYFMISGQSNQHYAGFIGATLMYPKDKPFFVYIPLLAVLYQMSRFVSIPHICILFGSNFMINSFLGKYIVDERLKKYQVWNQQRIMYGQGILLSVAYSFWAMLGLKQGFEGLKGQIFMKAVPGLGIIRHGTPVAFFCIFYSLVQMGYFGKGGRNSQLIGSSVLIGILFGLIFKRYRPLLK